MSDELTPGVLALSLALRRLQSDFDLDQVSATNRLPDGHALTMRATRSELSIEREDGWMLSLEGR